MARCDYKWCGKPASQHVVLRFPGGTFETDISLCPEHECYRAQAVDAVYRHTSILKARSVDLKRHGLVLPPREAVRAEMERDLGAGAPLILVHS